MNILYIDHYAGSVSLGMEFRPYYLAQEWGKLGHRVRIIAADFSHLRKCNPCIKSDFFINSIDGVEYQWIKTCEYKGNGFFRIWSMFQFCWKLKLGKLKILKDFEPDVVISSSTYPMDAYAAHSIANKSGAMHIHEVHDMWPITPIELYGLSPRNPFIILVQRAENYFCRKADKIVSILPCAEDYFVKHGMKSGNFIYIPNGIDVSDWNNPEPLPSGHYNAILDAKSHGRFVIAFFGSHTKSYGLEYLIEAIAKMDPSKVFVVFIGSGNYKENLIALAEQLRIDKNAYCFLPPINKKSVPSLLELVDASYVGAVKNRMFRFGIGMNKIFDAMMGAKPILYAVDAPNNFVEQFDCGISVAAENADEIKNGLETFVLMDEKKLQELGTNGRHAVLENYTYPILAKRFIAELQSNKR